LTVIFPLDGHARVREKYGQWYEYGSADERVAVRKDRDERKLKNLIVNADDLGLDRGESTAESRMPTGADW